MRGTLQVLREAPPPEAVQPSLAAVPALVERVRATGVDVRLVERGSAGGMTTGAATAAYRLVQEALTNTVKHAGAHPTVTVTIAHEPHASVVSVEDDGGDDGGERPAVPGAGVGLRGVEDRVQAAGGTFDAGPAGGGFRVSAEFRVAEGESPR
jgi:signal transduction histidine kinase